MSVVLERDMSGYHPGCDFIVGPSLAVLSSDARQMLDTPTTCEPQYYLLFTQ